MIPEIKQETIDQVANEWNRLHKEPFKFCVEQIEIYRDTNRAFLVAVDDLISQVFVDSESDDVSTEQKEVNRGRAFAVVCLALKMVGNQLEVNDLYKIYE